MNKSAHQAAMKRYYKKNRHILRAKRRVRYQENRETILMKASIYRERNRDALAERSRGYYADNPEKHRAAVKRWKRDNPIDRRIHVLSFSDPDCNVCNKWFGGCEGHHLTWNTGIYIPKELHRSVRHNSRTGRGMASINMKAMEWFYSGEIPGSKYVQTSLWDISNTSPSQTISGV